MSTILIVDDDVCIGDMLEEILTKEGYRTARAYSGTEALMYLSSARPDLILLDLMLPGLSGEELLPLIKDIPVIVVSAKAETSDKVGLLLGGACDYITKPFDTAELLARITVQLRRAASAPAPRHIKTADAESFPGHCQIPFAGQDQRRHSRLHRELSESTCQQSAEKAESS